MIYSINLFEYLKSLLKNLAYLSEVCNTLPFAMPLISLSADTFYFFSRPDKRERELHADPFQCYDGNEMVIKTEEPVVKRRRK